MYAELIDSMGDDLTVVNAARVSFAKEVEEFGERDTKLIKYLARHHHWTPFAHVTATFRVAAPIFVARQLFKHKVGLTENEISRRYVSDEPMFYQPEKWRGAPKNAKQGSDGVVADQGFCHGYHQDAIRMATAAYHHMLREGVAPEQARMVLPQSMLTEWYWTGSLAAFARVCKQRISKDAQAESGIIATDIYNQLSGVAPVSWAVLTEELISEEQ
jgi:thymidylate synthase (FAD)